MSNKLYDMLKYIAQVVLPALGTLITRGNTRMSKQGIDVSWWRGYDINGLVHRQVDKRKLGCRLATV